jgi:CsbD-like
MDWNRVEGNWKQVKGKVKEKWGKLTDDDPHCHQRPPRSARRQNPRTYKSQSW